MINTFVLLALCYGYISAADDTIRMRVVGGSPTTIDLYPSTSSVHMVDGGGGLTTICGGAVLSQRHILSAAHCFKVVRTFFVDPKRYKIRVGSELAHSGGTLHSINMVIFHPDWNRRTMDNDLAIMHTAATIVYSYTVRPAIIADFNYQLRDNESLWAVGWGITEIGHESEQLRDVEVLVINQNVCKRLYKHFVTITDTILCTGWLNGGGHDHCTRDSGSPIYHNGVVVGIASQARGCGEAEFPGINVRVSRFTSWIRDTSETHDVVYNNNKDLTKLII